MKGQNMETILIKKYYPQMKVVAKVKCKSIKDIGKESKLSKSTIYKLINGEHAIDVDKPSHRKAFDLLKQRAEEIDNAINSIEEEYIKIESDIFKKSEYQRGK